MSENFSVCENIWARACDVGFIAYAQMPPINANADVFDRAKGLDICLRVHLYPYLVYASSEGSG